MLLVSKGCRKLFIKVCNSTTFAFSESNMSFNTMSLLNFWFKERSGELLSGDSFVVAISEIVIMDYVIFWCKQNLFLTSRSFLIIFIVIFCKWGMILQCLEVYKKVFLSSFYVCLNSSMKFFKIRFFLHSKSWTGWSSN